MNELTFVDKEQHTVETAPDGSKLKLLTKSSRASMCLGELAAGEVSKPVSHKTVEELWLILEGEGEIRFGSIAATPKSLRAGTSFTIPPRTLFQFRNTSNVPLKFVFTTIPSWPGPDEAIEHQPGIW